VFSSPVVDLDEGVVYVGSGDHHVYACTLAEGRELWRCDLHGRVLGTPALVGDRLNVGGEGSGGDLPGAMFALDRRRGEVVWRFGIGRTVWSSPTAVGDSIWFGSHDGRIRRLVERRRPSVGM